MKRCCSRKHTSRCPPDHHPAGRRSNDQLPRYSWPATNSRAPFLRNGARGETCWRQRGRGQATCSRSANCEIHRPPLRRCFRGVEQTERRAHAGTCQLCVRPIALPAQSSGNDHIGRLCRFSGCRTDDARRNQPASCRSM